MTPLILVDVHNLAYRSFWAFKGLSFDNSPTGMFVGVLNAILGLKKKFGTRIIFCWDYGLPGQPAKPNWRKAIFPAYKTQRKHRDTELEAMQKELPALYQVFQDLGWGNSGFPGLEADDVIGLLSAASGKYGEVLIFSTDMDLYQLLDKERIRIVHPKKTKTGYQFITEETVKAEYGIPLYQWPQYLALGGDKSDNIHVMNGVGPKTSLKMLLLGANLEYSWAKQPETFKKKYPTCEEYWLKLQAGYAVARIPLACSDPRISNYVNSKELPTVSTYDRALYPSNREKALRKFTGFLADNGMNEMLSRRREFL